MPDRNEYARAFIETGALVLGGITGGGVSYLIFGDDLFLNAALAVVGAWLARSFIVARYRTPEQ